MSTTVTNGYTIRLELLKMAKDMLEREWESQQQAEQKKYEYFCEIIRDTEYFEYLIDDGRVEEEIQSYIPEAIPFPTEDQIIAKARVLNDFINYKV